MPEIVYIVNLRKSIPFDYITTKHLIMSNHKYSFVYFFLNKMYNTMATKRLVANDTVQNGHIHIHWKTISMFRCSIMWELYNE